MTTTEIFAGVSQLEAQALERFKQLARQLHAGEAIPPAEVLEIIRSAGKSQADLKRMVDALADRDKAQAQLEEYNRLQARNVELRKQIEAHNNELDARAAEHAAACRPLQFELTENQQKALWLNNAQQDLEKAEVRAKETFDNGGAAPSPEKLTRGPADDWRKR